MRVRQFLQVWKVVLLAVWLSKGMICPQLDLTASSFGQHPLRGYLDEFFPALSPVKGVVHFHCPRSSV
jgi:hypothetical protein